MVIKNERSIWEPRRIYEAFDQTERASFPHLHQFCNEHISSTFISLDAESPNLLLGSISVILPIHLDQQVDLGTAEVAKRVPSPRRGKPEVLNSPEGPAHCPRCDLLDLVIRHCLRPGRSNTHIVMWSEHGLYLSRGNPKLEQSPSMAGAAGSQARLPGQKSQGGHCPLPAATSWSSW